MYNKENELKRRAVHGIITRVIIADTVHNERQGHRSLSLLRYARRAGGQGFRPEQTVFRIRKDRRKDKNEQKV